MSTRVEQRNDLVRALAERFGTDPVEVKRSEVLEVVNSRGDSYPHFIINKDNQVRWGVYLFDANALLNNNTTGGSPGSSQSETAPQPQAVIPLRNQNPPAASLCVQSDSFTDNLVPDKDPLFVPFGNYKIVRDVIKSKMFYPIFITGLSGNGKTHMVEQSCASLDREVIRVNFTVETDEDDLIGGFRLVNGETKFFKGPVIRAMELGAVLLCDEIDLANPAKVMCLQSILEGSGYFIKKTGEFIQPSPGFTVIATANTKGKGSDSGQFIGTNILNEAFLERFPITCEQSYPTVSIEKKILGKVFEDLQIEDTSFIDKLVDWADIIRKTYYDEGVDEIISTRRLVHISRAYAIFDDRSKAIELCINRFDEDTKMAFNSLYEKIDADAGSSSELTDESIES